MFEFGT